GRDGQADMGFRRGMEQEKGGARTGQSHFTRVVANRKLFISRAAQESSCQGAVKVDSANRGAILDFQAASAQSERRSPFTQQIGERLSRGRLHIGDAVQISLHE